MPVDSADPRPPSLRLHTLRREDATVVQCDGKLTAAVADILHAEVKRLIPQNRRIVLDLTNLTQMDSSGLGMIVSLYVSAKVAGCPLELINLSKRMRDLLSITNLLSMFEICGEQSIRIP